MTHEQEADKEQPRNTFRDELGAKTPRETNDDAIDLRLQAPTDFRPRGDQITGRVIKRIKGDNKVGQLYLPEEPGNQYELVKVIAVGPGMFADNGTRGGMEDLEPGQIVIVKTEQQVMTAAGPGRMMNTVSFLLDGDEIRLISQSDVLVVLHNAQFVSMKESDNESD